MRGMKALIAGCAIVGGLAIGNAMGLGDGAHPDSNLNPLGSAYTLNPAGGTLTFGNGVHGSIPAGRSYFGSPYPYGSGAAGNAADPNATSRPAPHAGSKHTPAKLY